MVPMAKMRIQCWWSNLMRIRSGSFSLVFWPSVLRYSRSLIDSRNMQYHTSYRSIRGNSLQRYELGRNLRSSNYCMEFSEVNVSDVGHIDVHVPIPKNRKLP